MKTIISENFIRSEPPDLIPGQSEWNVNKQGPNPLWPGCRTRQHLLRQRWRQGSRVGSHRAVLRFTMLFGWALVNAFLGLVWWDFIAAWSRFSMLFAYSFRRLISFSCKSFTCACSCRFWPRVAGTYVPSLKAKIFFFSYFFRLNSFSSACLPVQSLADRLFIHVGVLQVESLAALATACLRFLRKEASHVAGFCLLFFLRRTHNLLVDSAEGSTGIRTWSYQHLWE